jgi:cytochrome oxidase Cu insertion factor (SCO1/SenC/PrrC family)
VAKARQRDHAWFMNRLIPSRLHARLLLFGGAMVLAACTVQRRTDRPLPTTTAPGFSLLDSQGERVSLDKLRQQHERVLVVFYRGHW